MAKFYQHMQPGETLGNITRLKYIDDISDDELILYVFEDKSKCSEEYIAEVNSQEAFNGQFVMTELSDPLNAWKFNVKEVDLTITKKVIGQDGQEYELPEPGVGINGEHMSLGITEDGTPITKTNNNLAGKRTDATPPRVVKNFKVEPKENYLLSLHPELLNPKLKDNKQSLLSHSINKPQTIVEKDNTYNNVKTIDTPVNNTGNNYKANINLNSNISSPISTEVIETVKHTSITININDIMKNPEFNKVNIISDDNVIELSVEDFINRILNKDKQVSVYVDPDFKEDILIKNMIDKSKKTECTIGMDITLELPPKEVYKTIHDVYPEGMAENFVVSLARRMNDQTLKEALAQGLTEYYRQDLENVR